MIESSIINMNLKGNKYIQQYYGSFDCSISENGNYTQKVHLIDINTTKTWIAYITKQETHVDWFESDVKWFLTISQLRGTDTNVDRYLFDITKAYDHDMPHTCMFLSIAPDGTRVAISFANVDADGKINSDPLYNKDCLVYKLNKDGRGLGGAVLELEKAIRFQGRAVFSGDNDLMLINKNVLNIYDEEYHMTSWFELDTFEDNLIMYTRKTFFTEDYTSNPRWSWSAHGLGTKESIDLKFIITMSQHIRHNILVSPYKEKIHAWHIADNGARLTCILRKEDEEIMAFSSSNKFLATYVHKTGEVNVYHIKSGIFLHSLKPKKQIPGGRMFEVTCIRFCVKDRYLVLTGLEKGDKIDNLELEVVFEAWHIESEQSIYSKNIKTQLRLEDVKSFAPFTMDRLPGSTAKDQKSSSPSYDDSRPLSESSSCSSRSTIKPKNSVKSYDSCGTTCRSTIGETPKHSIYAVYVARDDDDCEAKVNTLVINLHDVPSTTDTETSVKNSPSSVWVKATSDLPDTGDHIATAPTFSEAKKTICYVRSYLGEKYLLQFGKRLVQLWRLPKGSTMPEEDGVRIKTDDLGELLFIHAYKAPYYDFTNTFRESWSLKGKADEREMEKSISIIKQDNNTNDIDRIVVDIVMDQDEKTPLDLETQATLSEFSAELFIPFKEVVTKYSKFSKNSLHLYLKSGSQALHYLYKLKNSMQSAERPESEIQKITSLFEKTQAIVLKCVKRIANNKPNEYKYFSTINGSNILAMLASFKEGRNIIYLLLKIEQLPIGLISYSKKRDENLKKLNDNTRDGNTKNNDTNNNETKKQNKEQEKGRQRINENALTVLTDDESFDMYKLLFNRILLNSKTVGIGSLCVLTDVLMFLQETSNIELLISSSKKLSYLTVDTRMAHILDKDTERISKLISLEKTYIPSFRTQETYYFTEQIPQYQNTLISHSKHKWAQLRKYLTKITKLDSLFSFLGDKIRRLFQRTHHLPDDLCIVPLPYFLSYRNLPKFSPNDPIQKTSNDKNKDTSYKPESAFIKIATNRDENSVFMQEEAIFEVLLEYKWTTFVRIRFIIMYLFCLAYYICYTVGVSFAREVFSYQPGTQLTDGGHITCVAITIFSMLVLIIQEIRQVYEAQDKILYLISFYNWVDWATYLLSLASLLLLLNDGPDFHIINTFTTFLIWTHAILRLRIFPNVGIAIETIIQLIKEVGGILLTMVLVICAFTNGLITLLSHKEDAYFQEQYEGTVTYPGFNESNAPKLALADSSTQNDFGDVFNTFTNVWFFMFGVWDPITGGDAGDNKMIKVIAILFSFIVALIFSNILIAYMNSAIEKVRSKGTKAFISHYLMIIIEMEQIWCRKGTRIERQNNPAHVYYKASTKDVKKQEERLNKETRDLLKRLNVYFAKEKQSYYVSTLKDFQKKFENYSKLIEEKKETPGEVCKEWKIINGCLKTKLDTFKHSD